MLTESQRRRCVRGLFVASCLIPAAACLAWSLHRGGDSDRAAWEQRLSSHLGLRTQMERLRHPRPGVVLFERFRCYDPETDALVVDARAVEIEQGNDGFRLRASQPEVFADRAAGLFTALERRLRREFPNVESTDVFETAELTWHVPGQSQTLVDVRAELGPAESARQLLAKFSLPESQNGGRGAALRIRRSTAATPPETLVELDTGDAALPCSAAAPLQAVAASFGVRAAFAGKLQLRHAADGWRGTVVGDVGDVDLDALVSRRFPHKLSGTAELLIHRAEWNAGRLEHCDVTLRAQSGHIGRSLVASAAYHLGLGDPRLVADDRPVLPFDGLELDLTLDEAGVKLSSRSPDARHPILWFGQTIYWRQPPTPLQPAANLLCALVPERELMVPAARHVAGLMEIMPLPNRTELRPPEFGPNPIDVRLQVRNPDDPAQRR